MSDEYRASTVEYTILLVMGWTTLSLIFFIIFYVCICNCCQNNCCQNRCVFCYRRCIKRLFEKRLKRKITKINLEDVDDICVICLDDYMETPDDIGKLKCNHIFHITCLTKWLMIKNVCPLCIERI